LCQSHLALALRSTDRLLGGSIEHELWRCPTCGLGQTWPPLAPAALAPAYPPDYICYHQGSRPASGLRGRVVRSLLATQGYPQPDALPLPRPLARSLARARGWTWQPPPPPSGRPLDVGCGSGAYGASLIRLGWRVDGIEPDAIAAARARQAGLSVQAGAAETAELPAAAYDAITLWHTLEHLSEPLAVLRRLRPALRPSGRLLVEVPNAAGWVARATGAAWLHLDLPRHRFHFTPASLRLILDLAGFHLLQLEHIPSPHGLAGALACRRGQRRPQLGAGLFLGWMVGLGAAAAGRADVIRATAVSLP
jgi:SAM-dependent methyltransferase